MVTLIKIITHEDLTPHDRIAYLRSYYRANRDRILASTKTPERRAANRTSAKAYQARNRESVLTKAREYYHANRDRILARRRELRALEAAHDEGVTDA